MRRLAVQAAIALAMLLTGAASAQEPTPSSTPEPEATATDRAPAPTPAPPPPDRGSLEDLAIHAFVSPGFLVSTHRTNYLAQTSDRGSFEFSEVGINFTKPLSDRLRMGLQLFSRDLGPSGDYTAKLDWFYVDYLHRDWLGFRAGRVKVPFGLYNASSDIDQARVPVLLPQSVYPSSNRDFLLAQTGGEAYGFVRLGAAGAIDYRVYGGTIFLDADSDAGTSVHVPYIAGGRVLWEPIEGLRAGGSYQQLRLDARLEVPPSTIVTVEVPANLWVASLEYSLRDWVFATEFSRWQVEVDSSDPTVVPEDSVTSDRGYVMVTKRVNDRFHAGVYYSLLQPDTRYRSDIPSDYQHDVAATLRVDIRPNWLMKFEGHYMDGTAGLSPALNPDIPVESRAEQWGVFLVKTTAFF